MTAAVWPMARPRRSTSQSLMSQVRLGMKAWEISSSEIRMRRTNVVAVTNRERKRRRRFGNARLQSKQRVPKRMTWPNLSPYGTLSRNGQNCAPSPRFATTTAAMRTAANPNAEARMRLGFRLLATGAAVQSLASPLSSDCRKSPYAPARPDSKGISGDQPVDWMREISSSFFGVPSGFEGSVRISPG